MVREMPDPGETVYLGDEDGLDPYIAPTNVLNAVDDLGCDPTGQDDCGGIIDDNLTSGTLICFPPGDYKIGSSGFATVSGAIDDAGIYGLGDHRTDVQFHPTTDLDLWLDVEGGVNHLWANYSYQIPDFAHDFEVNWHADDNLHAHWVEWLGLTAAKTKTRILTRDGVGLIEGYVKKGPNNFGTYHEESEMCMNISMNHEGTMFVRNCDIRNASENGIYAGSGYSVHVKDSYFKNNQNTQVRIAGGDSSVENCTIVYDQTEGGYHPDNGWFKPDSDQMVQSCRALWQRGDEKNGSTTGFVAEDVDIIYRGINSNAMVICTNSHHGSSTYRNIQVELEDCSGDFSVFLFRTPSDTSDYLQAPYDCAIENCDVIDPGGRDDGKPVINAAGRETTVSDTCIDTGGPGATISGTNVTTSNISTSGCEAPILDDPPTQGDSDDGGGGGGGDEPADPTPLGVRPMSSPGVLAMSIDAPGAWQLGPLETSDEETMLDSFEAGDLTAYQDDTGDYAAVTHADAVDGDHVLERSSGTGYADIQTTGHANPPSPGDTWRWHPRTSAATTDGNVAQIGFLYGAQSTSEYYSARVEFEDQQLLCLRHHSSGTDVVTYTDFSYSYPGDAWLEVESYWGTNGTHRHILYDENGDEIDRIEDTEGSWGSGEFGWRTTRQDTSVSLLADYARYPGDTGTTFSGTVDSFEDQDFAEWTTDQNGPNADHPQIVSSPVQDGSYAAQLEASSGGNTQISSVEGDGLPAYPGPGDTVEVWWQTDDASAGADRIDIGPDSSNCYQVQLHYAQNELQLREMTSGTTTALASTAFTPSANTWYRLQVEWAGDGTFTITLYDASGTQQVQFTYTDTTHSSGGYLTLLRWSGGEVLHSWHDGLVLNP